MRLNAVVGGARAGRSRRESCWEKWISLLHTPRAATDKQSGVRSPHENPVKAAGVEHCLLPNES